MIEDGEYEMSEELEQKLDSPLVVHKPNDASFQDSTNEVDVNITHIEEDSATLERHRFKKVKKKKKFPYGVIIVVIIVAVVAALYYKGIIPNFIKKESTTAADNDVSQSSTEVNKFEGIITVKGTYLFYEGQEISGSEALIDKIKYLDTSKKFIVQDENADSTFLNNEILPVLAEYGINYEVKHIISSGLMSAEETTTSTTAVPLETTTQPVNENTDSE